MMIARSVQRRRGGARSRQPRSLSFFRWPLPSRLQCLLWLNRSLLLLALGMVIWGGQRGFQALLERPVQRVAVSGALAHVQREEIRGVVAANVSAGFVATRLRALRAELEALPWVYSASVRRRWPDTLEIAVVEQRPIARWGERGFLNHEAELFHTERAQQVQGLPLLDGPEYAQQRLMHQYLRLRALMASAGLQVLALQEDAQGQLRLELEHGLVLQLGDRDQQQRALRFLKLYTAELQPSGLPVLAVDMRYPSGAAVRFAAEQSAEPTLAALGTETAG